MEYLKYIMNELETNNKNIMDVYRDTDAFKRGCRRRDGVGPTL
jgi:hypothetical protein